MNRLLWPHNGTGPTILDNGPPGNGHSAALSSQNSSSVSGRAPRVLILSAAVGTGHLRAAEAVELAFRQRCPEASVRNVDVLSLSIPPFRRCYGGMYLDFVNKAPGVLGFFYNLMDRPRDCRTPSRWDRVRVWLEKIGLGRFLALLQEQPWDLIINTHFLPGEIVAELRRNHDFKVPQVMVTTDFETNHMWITEPCEHYFTATEEGAQYLQKQGVSADRTSVVGIPIHPVFCERKDRAACLARHALTGDRPLVLQLAGGDGVGRIEAHYRALLEVEEPLELVVVTGRNSAARQRLEKIAPPPRHRVKLLGFTTQIDELMIAADFLVSKPGGLTTSEALACGTPLVIVDPVPGQEDRNSDLLLENGAAVKVNHLATLPLKVNALLREPGRLAELRENARRLARPQAAFDVVERCLALLNPPPERPRLAPLTATLPAAPPAVTPNGSEPAAWQLRRTWHTARDWFDLLELEGLHVFARLWHHCSRNGPPPLPDSGPAIVIANHPNYSDPAFLVFACHRPLTFLQAKESFDTPILNRLFARAGSIPVSRTGRDLTAVRAAMRRLGQGEALCIFPEGEVTTSGRPIGPARTGVAFLALWSKAPVYPARIVGGPQSGSILRDWLWPSSGVRVDLGQPVDLSPYYGRRITHALLQEVTQVLMQRIAALEAAPRNEFSEAVAG